MSTTTDVEHWLELRGETLTTAREAGTPSRLVSSKPLLASLADRAIALVNLATLSDLVYSSDYCWI